MCIRCALAAALATAIAEMPPPNPGAFIDWGRKGQPEAEQADQDNHPAGNIEARLEDAYHTVKCRERENDRLRQELARVSEQNDQSRATYEAVRVELARVTELAMKFQEESRIATEMVKMLVKGQQP